jgi:hypothetical protein
MTERLISIRAAAKKVGVTDTTLGRQIRAGSIRSHAGKVRLSEVFEDRKKNVDHGYWSARKKPAGRGSETKANAARTPHAAANMPQCACRKNPIAPQPKKAPRFDRNEPLPLGMCDSPGTLGDLAKIILGPGEPTNRGDLAVITIMVAHDVLKLALKERFGHDSDAFKHPDLKDCTPTTIEKLGNLLGVTAPGDHLEVGHVALGFALEILEIAAHRHDATT